MAWCRHFPLLLVLLAVACRCGAPDVTPDAGEERKPATTTARCPFPVEPDAGVEPSDEARSALAFELFDRALESEQFEVALACAQEAARLAPDDARAHIDRGVALEGLDQFEAARDAYDRALALDPDEPEALRASADFLYRRGSDDALETAVLRARRGRELAAAAAAGAEFAIIEAGALNELGRSAEALSAAEGALVLRDDATEAQVERGVALFELLRFDEARKALEAAAAHGADSAKAAHVLGLLEERDGHEARATELLATATRLDAEAYPAALEMDLARFGELVKAEVARLEASQREALATTDFSWTDLPAVEDLQAGDPVLSPTIVGLFRPGERGARDAILIYRRNLLRVSRNEADLRREVRDTILHELGHLGGADDAELRDRGL